MPKGKLSTYIVWYSQNSKAKVRAFSFGGARRQAWGMLGDFKYGWTRSDFMKSATVQRV